MNQNILRQMLPGHPWAELVRVYGEVDSTNTMAKSLARQGVPEGTVLIADRQTAGRGRLGRSFLSPGGVGIYFSVVLRHNCPPQKLMHLTCAVGCAMCDAVEEICGFRPGIKWTNDLVVGKRKLGGILTELSVDPKTGLVEYVVVGIGINCRQHEADFDESIRAIACSAEMVSGRAVDRNALAAAMVRHLHKMSRELLPRQAELLDAYRRDCITLGKQISIVRGDEVRHGVALDIDAEGGLTVRYDSGEIGTVSSGEVSVRGLYGYI